jgi:hypothetical protein
LSRHRNVGVASLPTESGRDITLTKDQALNTDLEPEVWRTKVSQFTFCNLFTIAHTATLPAIVGFLRMTPGPDPPPYFSEKYATVEIVHHASDHVRFREIVNVFGGPVSHRVTE